MSLVFERLQDALARCDMALMEAGIPRSTGTEEDGTFRRSSASERIAQLYTKLQTAEQQLGQVREEVKRLTEALESTHMGRAVVHWMRAYDSVKCSDDNDENCQILRIPKNLIPKGATLVEAYETAKQFVIIGTPESDDESHNCDAMGCSTLSHVVARVNKSPATPSDGCGKGDTLSSRLPDKQGLWWWQSDGESAPVAVHIAFSGCGGDYFATIGQYGWTEPQSVKDMGGLWLKAVEPPMVPFHEFEEAASSKGKEGGE